MSRFVNFLSAQRELEIRLHLRILVLIQIHGDGIFGPQQGKQVEIPLHGIVGRAELAYIGISAVVERLTPVTSAVKITILRTGFDTVHMPHFADIYLAAFRPNDPVLLR